ncbi:MAG: succinylglutamate desuccinylase/aspartoacylase family protein [Candidatus Nitronauta litoralis]|uniref:Succinylglutamate desuccinylase/aspartoacylase family protein n=1 Tax=Candidatus Nitronauta litoralis TaxID=2705533 RepID=A0A7T0G1G1_9BACT|nr:MAG: succinylglutamate desuccinylase/aspartoacylase family protein [Candidatus Nitronauta litoralis]
MAPKFKIGGNLIKKGERKKIQLAVSHLYDGTDLSIPVEVIRGVEDGPVLFISAAIHGDEINGTEIISRILKNRTLKKLKGTLITVPVVNVFGFNMLSRYLPDRRDLNRSFPGSKNGSLASRLANIFMNEIVKKSTHGIDLHTGAVHRTNLPQIRAWMSNAETRRLAFDFGVPVILNSNIRDGSLREAARRKKIPMLLFEGGEALRFNEKVIEIGVNGCLSVMRSIGMLPKKKHRERKEVFVSWGSQWLRAPVSGLVHTLKNLGTRIKEGDSLGVITDQFGKPRGEIISPIEGIIIGQLKLPLVNGGDALYHIAGFHNTKKVHKTIEQIEQDIFQCFYD